MSSQHERRHQNPSQKGMAKTAPEASLGQCLLQEHKGGFCGGIFDATG